MATNYRYVGSLACIAVSLGAIGVLTACAPAPVNDPRVADDGADWAAGGRDYTDQHFSPLTQINDRSISRLGLVWAFDIPAPELAVSTPVEVNGVLYTSTGYNITRAFSAATGVKLWEFDPHVTGPRMRAAWGTRGLAYWNNHVIIATVDGRLISLDAASGKVAWSTQTLESDDSRYITGAARVFGDRVIIGNGGADNGNRGYVTTYDARTGKQLWRFFTVPGDPAKGFENPTMAMAAKTWHGTWWKNGGGGTVWNAITYDPELNTIYIGAGNGAPWNQKVRSPGGGDNLFLCSIVALDADTGVYKWHYQVNPGETWDYTATMDMELATLQIDGKAHKVLLQAPKNGFFYVIDRETGKLLSAEKFAKVTWASRIDLPSGRPVESSDARYPAGRVVQWPGTNGGHNWQPMSFNPRTGLVYIPHIEMPALYDDSGIDPSTWQAPASKWVLNSGLNPIAGDDIPINVGTGSLIAWDPVAQRKAWEIPQPSFWNGGTLTTAGNLVFQGRTDGQFLAYTADLGKPAWAFDAQAGIIGAPITYRVDGRQYVSVIVGYGATGAMFGSLSAQFGWRSSDQPRRVLTFALDGRATLPQRKAALPSTALNDTGYRADPALALKGKALYHVSCFMCHGIAAVAGGQAPDLRSSAVILQSDAFNSIVLKGTLESAGMPLFQDFTEEDTAALRQYLRSRAHDEATATADNLH